MKTLKKDLVWGIALGGMLSPILILMIYSLISRPPGGTGAAPPRLPIDQIVNLDWEVEATDGTRVTLSTFRDRPIILNLWATWCGPCVREMPTLEALYKQYGDRVAFVCISNEDMPTINAFVEKTELTLPIYKMADLPPAIFRTPGIPATFVIGSGAVLRVKHEGQADWSAANVQNYLDLLLAEPTVD